LRGEIVVTDLNNTLMPLVRYKVGDEVVLREGSCACGRTLPMLASVSGRTLYQYFHLPTGRKIHSYLFEYFIDELLKSGIAVKQFQVAQRTRPSIVLSLVLESDTREQRERVKRQFERNIVRDLSRDVSLAVEFLERIVPPHGRKNECFQPLLES
jgi:phenylacetate-CoA ligase